MSRYQNHAFLKARESSELLGRLADVSRTFPAALDLGSHCGEAANVLVESGQVEAVTCYEPSLAMSEVLKDAGQTVVRGPLETLPFDPGQFDLVTSVQALHWVNDLPGALTQIRRILKPDGLFLGCLFGGSTLTELRQSLVMAETEILGGASPRISPMPALQDMAGLLQRAGFALPVADIDRVSVRYSHPLKLMDDLRGMAEQAAFAVREGQVRRSLSPRIIARMCDIYRERFADPDGKVRATFEVIWMSGWAPADSQPKPLRPGSAKFSLAEAVKRAGKTSGEG